MAVNYASPSSVYSLTKECDTNQVPASVNLQTRIKYGDVLRSQEIPLQVQGPRPPTIPANIRLDKNSEDSNQQPQQKQSFLRKYVSFFQ